MTSSVKLAYLLGQVSGLLFAEIEDIEEYGTVQASTRNIAIRTAILNGITDYVEETIYKKEDATRDDL